MSDDDGEQWLSPAQREAWLGAAGLVVRLPAALDAQLQADAGLSFFEYMILAVLSEQDDRALQMSEIARFSSSSLSRLSHTVGRLEKQGLVTRTRLPGPGRRTLATLTDAGMDKVVAAAPGHVRRVRELLVDAVPPEHLEILGQVGRTVLGQIDPTDDCLD
jgi:DNA-binding MarR family transcriptional regulator